jgi:hypothetical protein
MPDWNYETRLRGFSAFQYVKAHFVAPAVGFNPPGDAFI